LLAAKSEDLPRFFLLAARLGLALPQEKEIEKIKKQEKKQMKKTRIFARSCLSLLVILALLAAMALTFTACSDDEDNASANAPAQTDKTSDESPKTDTDQKSDDDDDSVLGQGATEIAVKVVFADESEKTFTVKTDKTNVGDALVEVGLISGEDGDYGWFITTIDGEYHKWEDDGKYWAFYIDGEYAMTGVSGTEIVAGTTYEFRAE